MKCRKKNYSHEVKIERVFATQMNLSKNRREFFQELLIFHQSHFDIQIQNKLRDSQETFSAPFALLPVGKRICGTYKLWPRTKHVEKFIVPIMNTAEWIAFV